MLQSSWLLVRALKVHTSPLWLQLFSHIFICSEFIWSWVLRGPMDWFDWTAVS